MIVGDHRLPVAAEEIDFQSGDAHVLEPLELLDAVVMSQQTVSRGLWSGIPRARRVIPNKHFHAFGSGVFAQVLHLVVADLLVPQRVDQAIAPAHVRGVVDETFLNIVNRLRVLQQRPTPCRLAGNDIFPRGFRRSIRQIDAEHRFGHSLQTADRDDPPRCGPWQGGFRGNRSAETTLAWVRIADGVLAVRRLAAQACGAMVPVKAGLAEQHPGFARAKQGRIDPARSGGRRFANRDVHLIMLFV